MSWENYVLLAPEPGRARDLDETRRLLYIALFAAGKDYPAAGSLIGTLVNALAHHGAAVDPDEAGTMLVQLIENSDPAAVVWAKQQITNITGLLGDDPAD